MLGKNLIQAASGAAGGAGPQIGDFYEGGYFAGYISQTADGNATHGLIVAPADSGYDLGYQYKTSNTATSGTSSTYDGAANTANMANTSHPAANYCANLTINGYSDWYLPALYELEIAYYNLKPSSSTNWGNDPTTNPYAVPARTSNYTATDPAKTSVALFDGTTDPAGAESFIAKQIFIYLLSFHWTSTSSSNSQATMIDFRSGRRVYVDKNRGAGSTDYLYTRAFRKFAV